MSSVSPAARMSPIERRRWGEGSGGRGGASPALARTEMPPSSDVSSTMTTSLASAPWSTRVAASNSSGEVPALEGERAEGADGGLLGEAMRHPLAPDRAVA